MIEKPNHLIRTERIHNESVRFAGMLCRIEGGQERETG